MQDISRDDIARRLRLDNPWWSSGKAPEAIRKFRPRHYHGDFVSLVGERRVQRAVLLLGPRRVGKTVLVHHCIQSLLEAEHPKGAILYASLDTPVYAGMRLDQFVEILLSGDAGHTVSRSAPITIFFDEIQYAHEWEVQLKSLVDSFPDIRFVGTGSAAAALRTKSAESGAGRFTHFMLPPLTFYEYVQFAHQPGQLIDETPGPNGPAFSALDIQRLNAAFVDYINYGAYPEAVFNDVVRNDVQRFIKDDVVEKVLLRDLPSLYGISNIQEINRLLSVLAYNTGDELSLEGLSRQSGVSKDTLNKYLEYLESAFLIRRIDRVDENAQRFQRRTKFKVYLTNPSMRSALFGAIDADDAAMGRVVETALFAQWLHDPGTAQLHYARWRQGRKYYEVDLIGIDVRRQQACWALEVKWSDKVANDQGRFATAERYVASNAIKAPLVVTTRTAFDRHVRSDDRVIWLVPSALYAYVIGHGVLAANVGAQLKTPR